MGGGAITSSVTGSAALLLLSLACIVATVIVYAALVVRKVLIVVTAIFAPIAFAGSLADITASWTRRWIETTIALIASKLILILIFIAGYGILIHGVGESGTGASQKVTQVISGILVLFVAGFAPWMAIKLVHFTGDQAHQLHSLGSSAVGGVSTGGRMAQKAAPYAARAGGVPAAADRRGLARQQCNRRPGGRCRRSGYSGPRAAPATRWVQRAQRTRRSGAVRAVRAVRPARRPAHGVARPIAVASAAPASETRGLPLRPASHREETRPGTSRRRHRSCLGPLGAGLLRQCRQFHRGRRSIRRPSTSRRAT